MRYLTNAFSLNMLEGDANLDVVNITRKTAAEMAYLALSVVGHADTAAVFADVLGYPVYRSRENIVVKPGDTLIVGQYKGPRLPEGATTLPEGASIQWMLVNVT